MAEGSDEEKNLPASERRIEQAREEGNVVRSRELVTAAVILSSLAVFYLGGEMLSDTGQTIMRQGLQFNHASAHDQSAMLQQLTNLMILAVKIILPFGIVTALLALASSMALGGWNFTTKSLLPDFTKLSPMRGLGNIFSWNGLGELIKAILKSIFLGGVGVWLIWRDKEAFVGMLYESSGNALEHLIHIALKDFMVLTGLLVVLAAMDVPFQIWRYYSQLKMSLEEYKKESKETEGDPHIKGRIRQQQREMAKKRMMAEVPKADVIVTNPTHYAVALKYQENGLRAPIVVAKGVDEVAARIRELGAEHGVLQLEAPPLARALYAHTELEQEIPVALYSAVAQVLAYVFQLRKLKADGYPTDPYNLPLPTELPVPSDLDPLNVPQTT